MAQWMKCLLSLIPQDPCKSGCKTRICNLSTPTVKGEAEEAHWMLTDKLAWYT